MATAEDDDLIERSPCRVRVTKARRVRAQRTMMEPADVARLLPALPLQMRPVMLLLIGGHVRPGEIIALQRRDLDLDTATLNVERQIITSREQGQVPTDVTKTGATGSRILPQVTVLSLRHYLATVPKRTPRALLITNSRGGALTVNSMGIAFRKACDVLDHAKTGRDPESLGHAVGTKAV